MIAEIKIRNLFSFRDDATLSFEADSSKELESHHVISVTPTVRLLKLGVIYGANASGKSNFIRGYSFFKSLINKIPTNKSDKIGISPFMLNDYSRNELSYFSVTFYLNINKDVMTKFIYSISLNDEYIGSESLIYYPSQQPAVLFERYYNNGTSQIKFGDKLQIPTIAKNEIIFKCLPNMSLLAAYTQVNLNTLELESVLNYFNLHKTYTSDAITLFGWNANNGVNDLRRKNYILKYLQAADFNISNISNESDKEILFSHVVNSINGNSSQYELGIESESKGTMRTLDVATYTVEAIENNSFLAIDEIESSLHPKLVEYIIERFLQESDCAQLLLTTHYDGLLAQDDLLRKDNIWFAEKGADGSSTLYPLTDFKGLSRISSLQKAYKYGKFGAVPNV